MFAVTRDPGQHLSLTIDAAQKLVALEEEVWHAMFCRLLAIFKIATPNNLSLCHRRVPFFALAAVGVMLDSWKPPADDDDGADNDDNNNNQKNQLCTALVDPTYNILMLYSSEHQLKIVG